MNIKLKGSYLGDVLDIVVENRGIKNLEEIKNPTYEILNPFQLQNIEAAIEMYVQNINSSKILIIVDSDVDGITSASLLYQFSKIIKPNSNISLYFHSGKQHGLSKEAMDYIINNNYKFVILPDAGTNDFDEIDKLSSLGIDVLILDHHQVERMNQKAVIVNNQLNINQYQNFSGVGVTFLFVQALIMKYNLNVNAYIFADIVALGMIADSMDAVDSKVRFLCEYGFDNVKNKLLKEYYKNERMNYTRVSWGIASMINAVIREGTVEDKKALFYALSIQDNEETFFVEKKRKNKETGKFDKVVETMNYYEKAIDDCKKIKDRQDNKVKKVFEEIKEQYDNENIGIFTIKEEYKNLSGLIANKMVEQIQRPVIIGIRNNGTISGSARGYSKFSQNFRDLVLETKLVNYASGHNNAFGISIDEENLEEFQNKFKNKKMEDVTYYVDFIYRYNVRKEDIRKITDLKNSWSKNFEEPLFAVEFLDINVNKITYKNGIMRFFKNGITYIKKGATKEEFEYLTEDKDSKVIFKAVGKFALSSWKNKEYEQFEIQDYTFEKKPLFKDVDYSGFF